MSEEMKERRDLKGELATRGLSQTRVAQRMGITRFYLSHLLAGRKPWTRRTARDFSMATGISLDAVLLTDDLEVTA